MRGGGRPGVPREGGGPPGPGRFGIAGAGLPPAGTGGGARELAGNGGCVTPRLGPPGDGGDNLKQLYKNVKKMYLYNSNILFYFQLCFVLSIFFFFFRPLHN